MANSVGSSGYSTIAEAKDAWAKANAAGDKAGMEAAHQAAENIRAQSGYSGGADGSQVIVTNQNLYNSTVGKSANTDSDSLGSVDVSKSSGNTATDYSKVSKYNTSLLPSSIDNYSYASTLSYNPKFGQQSNVTTAQGEKYLPTVDPEANSNIWWQVNNDDKLNQSQKNYLQQLLHEANTQILGDSANYDSHTGNWTNKTTGNVVNKVTDNNKYSRVVDTNRTPNTIDYTMSLDGKYYYNGKELKPVELREATGAHVGEAFVINGKVYKRNDNWTATPLSDTENVTGKKYAIFDGTNVRLIPDTEYKSYVGNNEDYRDYMDVDIIQQYVDAFLEEDNTIDSEEEAILQDLIQQYLTELYGGEN